MDITIAEKSSLEWVEETVDRIKSLGEKVVNESVAKAEEGINNCIELQIYNIKDDIMEYAEERLVESLDDRINYLVPFLKTQVAKEAKDAAITLAVNEMNNLVDERFAQALSRVETEIDADVIASISSHKAAVKGELINNCEMAVASYAAANGIAKKMVGDILSRSEFIALLAEDNRILMRELGKQLAFTTQWQCDKDGPYYTTPFGFYWTNFETPWHLTNCNERTGAEVVDLPDDISEFHHVLIGQEVTPNRTSGVNPIYHKGTVEGYGWMNVEYERYNSETGKAVIVQYRRSDYTDLFLNAEKRGAKEYLIQARNTSLRIDYFQTIEVWS